MQAVTEYLYLLVSVSCYSIHYQVPAYAVCGDGLCMADIEDCHSCSVDCCSATSTINISVVVLPLFILLSIIVLTVAVLAVSL